MGGVILGEQLFLPVRDGWGNTGGTVVPTCERWVGKTGGTAVVPVRDGWGMVENCCCTCERWVGETGETAVVPVRDGWGKLGKLLLYL